MLGWLLLRTLMIFAQAHSTARLAMRVCPDLRGRMFERLQRLSSQLFAFTPVGEIAARFSTDLAVGRGGRRPLAAP
jgi:ABC-type multidrug transport system fused ATPase/permease subunit